MSTEPQSAPPQPQAPQSKQPDWLPLALKAYGVLALIGGYLTVATSMFTIFNLVRLVIENGPSWPDATMTSLIIGIVQFVIGVVLAVMYIVLGIRLLRNERRYAATLAYSMIALAVGTAVCRLMLDGIGIPLLLDVANIVILTLISVYLDPALAEERQLKRQERDAAIRDEAERGGRDTTGKGFVALNFFNLFWIFVIASVVGLGIETLYRLVTQGILESRAGLLWGPFSPIYGFGSVVLTIALNRLHDKHPLVIFLASALIGGAFEYVVHWFMEVAFGITAWGYGGPWFNEDGSVNLLYFMNINGRTNLIFMVFWGILGLAWIKLALPQVLRLVNMIPWNLRYVLTTVAFVAMLVNGGMTLIALDCWYERVSGHTPTEPIEVFCAEQFDDAFMQQRFETMSIHPGMAARVNR